MRSRDTTYRLARTPQDYKRCHTLLAVHGQDEPQLSWPTIMAWRDGEVVGCLSTQATKEAIIAGPIAVISPRPFWAMVRLAEAYEVVLRQAGVQGYWFGIDLAQHRPWYNLVRKVGLVPTHQDHTAAWFYRALGG